MTPKKTQYFLLFLNRLPFLKPREKLWLHTQGFKLDNILNWDRQKWQQTLGRRLRTQIFNYIIPLRGANYDIWWKNTQRGWLCFIDDAEYPALLREISDPPIVLYGRGRLSTLSHPAVSIVGTRSPDEFGIWAAQNLGKRAAEENLQVVSGLAYGIDAHGQQGAIEHGGLCTVVLGTAIDSIYPRRHRNLAQQILRAGGAIISEIAPASHSAKYHFVGRNRIISALSMLTIIVQAPEKSGALITAEFALEQNRSVAVHRAGIQSEFMGTERLWSEGAEYLDFG